MGLTLQHLIFRLKAAAAAASFHTRVSSPPSNAIWRGHYGGIRWEAFSATHRLISHGVLRLRLGKPYRFAIDGY